MKKLIIRLHNGGTFRNKSGKISFRYAVSGSAEALEAFKEARGEFYSEDENGVALFYSQQFLGKTGSIAVTDNGKIVTGSNDLAMLNSLAEQYPALASSPGGLAVLKSMMGGSDTMPAPAATPATTPAVEDFADVDEALDDLAMEK